MIGGASPFLALCYPFNGALKRPPQKVNSQQGEHDCATAHGWRWRSWDLPPPRGQLAGLLARRGRQEYRALLARADLAWGPHEMTIRLW